jgi:phosphatidylglycerophosphate synthase
MKQQRRSWTFWHAVVMILATAVSIIYEAPFVLIWAVSLSMGILIAIHYPVWITLRPVGGYANHMTLGRFVLLLCAMSMQHVLSPTVFVMLIVIVMIADGIDGYLARKFEQATLFGEIFDAEVDAFLALSLAFLIWQMHENSGWVLAAGLLRYIVVILYRLIGWHQRQRPAMPEAKVLAVIFFISLLVPFVTEWMTAKWFVGAGCILVAISFAREMYLISQVTEAKKGEQ